MNDSPLLDNDFSPLEANDACMLPVASDKQAGPEKQSVDIINDNNQ